MINTLQVPPVTGDVPAEWRGLQQRHLGSHISASAGREIQRHSRHLYSVEKSIVTYLSFGNYTNYCTSVFKVHVQTSAC